MQRFIQILLTAAIFITLVSLLHAQPYLFLTNEEVTRFGDRIKFWHGDTLDGPIHSNSMIAIMQDPVFTDLVTSTANDFWHGSSFDAPLFLGPLPRFNYPRVEIPNVARSVRSYAISQGHYYPDSSKSYYARFSPGLVTMAMWEKGQLMDTVSTTWTIPIINRMCIFVNGPLFLHGIVGGAVSIGASNDIHLLNDIRYADTDSHGHWIDNAAVHPNYLGIVSERNVKVDNTPANGRWNSNGAGLAQTNLDSTSIVITASIIAQGESFTFDQQNDPDSGYVCTDRCNCGANGHSGGPDDRGYIYFLGSIVQTRRGYVHRSMCMSTGYHHSYHYDRRLYNNLPPGYPPFGTIVFRPDSVNFGDVIVGQMAVDTVDAGAQPYGALYASYPFTAQHLPNEDVIWGRVVVRFIPPHAALYTGMLTVGTYSGEIIQIPIRGRGVHPAAPPISFDISPNPFNLTTTLRFSLRDGGDIKMTIFDLLGRTVREINLANQAPGEHVYTFDASGLATGVYFVRMAAGAEAVTRKVLLLK